MIYEVRGRFFFQIIILFSVYLFASTVAADTLFRPQVENDEYFSETFTLLADLENGAYIYGQIGVSNIGPGDERGVCRILISEPTTRGVFDHSIIVDKKEWFFLNGEKETLQVKDCHISYSREARTVEFQGGIKHQAIKITLHTRPEKYILPFHRVSQKTGYYQSTILVPWAAASVEYQMAGTLKRAKGFGYADHSRSTLLPVNIAYQWIRFRGLAGNSAILLARQTVKDAPFEGWLWRKKGLKPEILSALRLSMTLVDDVQHWQIQGKDNAETFMIKTQKRLLRSAPLEGKGFLYRALSFVVGNPVTYTYRAKFVAAKDWEVPGILEVARTNGD